MDRRKVNLVQEVTEDFDSTSFYIPLHLQSRGLHQSVMLDQKSHLAAYPTVIGSRKQALIRATARAFSIPCVSFHSASLFEWCSLLHGFRPFYMTEQQVQVSARTFHERIRRYSSCLSSSILSSPPSTSLPGISFCSLP